MRFKYLSCRGYCNRFKGGAAKEEVRVQIEHGERIAVFTRSFLKSEFTFEIGGPDEIRFRRSNPRRSLAVELRSLCRRMASAPGANQALSLEEFTDRARRRPALAWMSLYQSVPNGLSTVLRIFLSDGDDALGNLGCNAATMILGRMRSLV